MSASRQRLFPSLYQKFTECIRNYVFARVTCAIGTIRAGPRIAPARSAAAQVVRCAQCLRVLIYSISRNRHREDTICPLIYFQHNRLWICSDEYYTIRLRKRKRELIRRELIRGGSAHGGAPIRGRLVTHSQARYLRGRLAGREGPGSGLEGGCKTRVWGLTCPRVAKNVAVFKLDSVTSASNGPGVDPPSRSFSVTCACSLMTAAHSSTSHDSPNLAAQSTPPLMADASPSLTMVNPPMCCCECLLVHASPKLVPCERRRGLVGSYNARAYTANMTVNRGRRGLERGDISQALSRTMVFACWALYRPLLPLW